MTAQVPPKSASQRSQLLAATIQRVTGLGWPVLPLHTPVGRHCSCGRATCQSPGKHPRAKGGVTDATTDAQLIRQWWTQWPEANIGIATGTRSIVVLDIDDRHGGGETLLRLEKAHGKLPETVSSRTGGGVHLYFAPPAEPLRSSAAVLGPGLDIRAEGGYVVAPGSLHASGEVYAWEDMRGPGDVELASLPPWVLAALTRAGPTTSPATHGGTLVDGCRNNTLASLAGTMRRRGMSRAAIEAALLAENQARCSPPLEASEVRSIAASISRYPSGDAHHQFEVDHGKMPDSAADNYNESENRAMPSLQLRSLREVLEEPEAESDWLVNGLLTTGGISVLVAKPKVGKSTLAQTLMYSVARGENFLGLGVKSGPVVYFALEEKQAFVRERFQRMGARDEPIHMHFGSVSGGIPTIAAAVSRLAPHLVVVDPMLRLISLRDANDYAEVTRTMAPLMDLARSTGTHILLVHHSNKAGHNTDAILGSTAIFAAVDTALMMERSGSRRTLWSSQRYGDDLPETIVTFDQARGLVGAGGCLEVVQTQSYVSRVLDAIGEESLTEEQIKGKVGGDRTQVSKAIRAAISGGQLSKDGMGHKGSPYQYRRLPDTPDPRFTLVSSSAQSRNNDRGVDREGVKATASDDAARDGESAA